MTTTTARPRHNAFGFSDPHHSPSSRRSAASLDSCHSDEGYHSDDKPNDTFEHDDSTRPDREIPILKSTYTIRISYTPQTLALTLLTIGFSIHTLITDQPFWTLSFPAVFVFFDLLFHVTHLFAHYFDLLTLERLCVVYGTSIYWNGWLLCAFVFSDRPLLDLRHPTGILFWLLLLERRNAWGIMVWEFVSRLQQNLPPSMSPFATKIMNLWHLGIVRTLVFRMWCLFGTGGFWGFLYLVLAIRDGFPLFQLLKITNILRVVFVSVLSGLSMISFWSFWTFQYRGIVWKDDMRKGVAIWFSDGFARAGDVY